MTHQDKNKALLENLRLYSDRMEEYNKKLKKLIEESDDPTKHIATDRLKNHFKAMENSTDTISNVIDALYNRDYIGI